MSAIGRNLLKLSRTSSRQFSTTVARRGDFQMEGVPGSNLPFSINNRYALAAGFIVFFGSGFAAPFILVRHQLLKDVA